MSFLISCRINYHVILIGSWQRRIPHPPDPDGACTVQDLRKPRGNVDFTKGFIKATTVDTSDNTTGNVAKYDWIQANGTGGLHANYELNNLTVYNGSSNIIEYTEMPKSRTYEDINGHSAQSTTLSVSIVFNIKQDPNTTDSVQVEIGE